MTYLQDLTVLVLGLGYGVVGLFVVTWALAYGVWKVRRIEERGTAYAVRRPDG